MLRKMKKDDEAIAMIVLMLIFGLACLILFGIFVYFFVQMLVSNILPIAIAIVLVIAIPIVAKGWYYTKTKKEYPGGGGIFG